MRIYLSTVAIVVAAVLLGALLGAAAANAADPMPLNGSALVSCNRMPPLPGFPDAVDPIVSYGAVPSAHEHAFWGSDQASPTTTLPQLYAGGTGCDVKSDRSLYWHPAIRAADGHIVYPNKSSFYYRAANRGVFIHPFPAGLRFVWGNPNNTGSSGASFRCGGQTYRGRSIPTTCNGAGMQEDMYVAPCWNGKDLGAGGGGSDNITGSGNVTSAPVGADGKPHCPPGWIDVPSLQYIINWPPAAVGGRLTSDHDGAIPGSSAHIDFFNGWTQNSQGQDAMALLTDRCLNVDALPGSVTCQVINGQILTYPGRVYVTD